MSALGHMWRGPFVQGLFRGLCKLGGCSRDCILHSRSCRFFVIAVCPGADYFSYVIGVSAICQHMIGTIKADKTFGMARGHVNVMCVLDADNVVYWAVEDEERLSQITDRVLQAVGLNGLQYALPTGCG